MKRLIDRCKPRTVTASLTIALLVVLGSGCSSTKDLYYWGEYENLLHTYYTEPGAMPAARQIEILTRTIQQAKDKNKYVAPGIYAQLGLAYADLGNSRAAEEAFNKEAELFPESKHMLDGMMQRAKQAAADKNTANNSTTDSKQAR